MYFRRDVYNKMLEWKNSYRKTTLQVSGARQVGKTFLVKKFAENEYKNVVYINLMDESGEDFLYLYDEIKNRNRSNSIYKNVLPELLREFSPNFEDTKDTVVIIDEIQESSVIFNRIREFTRNFKCDFIVTGSYLGHTLNKEFWFSAGDITSLEITTLSFEEFLDIFDKRDLFNQINFFGNSKHEYYDEISKWYQLYCKIGGYPAVVLEYLNNKSIEKCYGVLIEIIHIFINESRRYFDDILDYNMYELILLSIVRLLAREKRGIGKSSINEELHKIITKDYSSNISKSDINHAINWFYSSGIIGFCGKIDDCNTLELRHNRRYFLLDLGLTSYLSNRMNLDSSTINGIISENFVYLFLNKETGWTGKLKLECPTFATYKQGEIDFYAVSDKKQLRYGIEVKSGKNKGKSVLEALKDGKIDYALYAKGNTYGGVNEDIITIPIYLISRFDFENPFDSEESNADIEEMNLF